MSSIKRHKPDQYRRTQEAIRVARIQRKVEIKLETAVEVFAAEARRQGRSLRMRMDSARPRTSARSKAVRSVSSLVVETAAIIGRRLVVTFSHVHAPPPSLSPPPTPGPARHRVFEFPPAISSRWCEVTGRYIEGATAVEREFLRRRDGAIEWSGRCAPGALPRLADHGLAAGDYTDPMGLQRGSTVEWRVTHHHECGLLESKECNCGMAVDFRIGAQVFRVERAGSFGPIIEPPIRRSDVEFFRDRIPRGSDQKGFPGDFRRDRSGRLQVPTRGYVEFGGGLISFEATNVTRFQESHPPADDE